jgi:hypothetical protein
MVRSCIAGLIAGSAFISSGASAGSDADALAPESLALATGLVREVREATVRFRDIENARKENYELFLGCVSGHDEGAMGIHYVNSAYVDDPTLDPAKPEALIYEQRNGRMQLIAVEFVVIAEAWDAANPAAPVLRGQTFNYSESPNRYRLPAFYELHVWAWKDNPNGTFVDFNPDVSCDEYAPD